MAEIQLVTESGETRHFPVNGDIVIGRHSDCDIVIRKQLISRNHTKIIREQGAYFVEDLGSVNGTYLNDKPISARTQLSDRDRIRVHDVTLLFLDVTGPGSSQIQLSPEGDTGVMSLSSPADAKLLAVVEISKNLGSTSGQRDSFGALLETALAVFPQSQRAFVLRPDRNGQNLEVRDQRFRDDPQASGRLTFSRTIANHVMQRSVALLGEDIQKDEDLIAANSVAEIAFRSMMCAPLLGAEGTPIGVVQVEASVPIYRFTRDDLELLASLAAIAGHAAETSRVRRNRLRLELHQQEMKNAYEVQRQFLPRTYPDIRDFIFFHHYHPAELVGGDFFDYIELPRNRLAVIVADVCGKGMPAALMVSRLSAEVRFSLATQSSPTAAIIKMNQTLFKHEFDGRFITMVLCVIDLATHDMATVNCGHIPPLIYRSETATVEEFGSPQRGPALGLDTQWQYTQVQTHINAGDRLILHTDGISEARNKDGDLFRTSAVRDAVCIDGATPEQIGQKILTDMQDFAGDTPGRDDVCLVCFTRTR